MYSHWQRCFMMLCLCYVMLCYVMLCYVMLCYVMLCYVWLCYVKRVSGLTLIYSLFDIEAHEEMHG